MQPYAPFHFVISNKLEIIGMNFIRTWRVCVLAGVLGGVWGGMGWAVRGQEQTAPGALPMPSPVGSDRGEQGPGQQERSFLPSAASAPAGKPLPINLPTALKLGDAQAIDVQVASEKIRLAAAQLQQARVLWVPTMLMGGDYFRHDGQIQNVTGDVVNNSHASYTLGASPILIFTATDALFAPLAQRQVLKSQQAFQQAAQNDTMLAVAEAYFQVQQARGELAGVQDARGKMEDLARRIAQLAEVLVPPSEKRRAETQFARLDQAVYQAQERWRIASAELNRLLRLDPITVVQPLEPPHLQVTLIDGKSDVDALIRVGLTNRPELRGHQALVQAALRQLQKERMRPLLPSVLLRGGSTGVFGTLGLGFFGGGTNGNLNNTGLREDYDLQVLWELQSMGLANRALVKQRQSDHRLAMLELFRTQDRIAAEVAQAHAQVELAAKRLQAAERETKAAFALAEENMEGFRQTRRVGELPMLVVRAQEAIAAVQTLALAYNDYYGAIADHNRAQFRLYRAVGNAPAAVADLCPSQPPPEGADKIGPRP
jgi:outer membrane protein TolC